MGNTPEMVIRAPEIEVGYRIFLGMPLSCSGGAIRRGDSLLRGLGGEAWLRFRSGG